MRPRLRERCCLLVLALAAVLAIWRLAAVQEEQQSVTISLSGPRTAAQQQQQQEGSNNNNYTELLSYLRRWRRPERSVLILQSSNMFRAPLARVSNSSVHMSALAMSTYARRNHYAYLFVDQHSNSSAQTTRGPFGNASGYYAYYWLKVPSTSILTECARLAGIENVLVVDTDVYPTAHSPTNNLDEYIRRRGDQVDIVSSSAGLDADWYATEVENIHRIPYKPINSGVVLYRTRPSALRLLHRLWYELTSQVTPYEASDASFSVLISYNSLREMFSSKLARSLTKDWASLRRGALNALHDATLVANFSQLAKEEILNQFPNEAGLDVTYFTLLEYSLPRIRFHLVRRPDMPPLHFVDTIFPQCCKERRCRGPFELPAGFVRRNASLVRDDDSPSPEMKCSILHVRNSLMAWPGDQDRLNWLMMLEPEKTRISSKLGGGCFHRPRGLLEPLFEHYCFNDKSRVVYALQEARWFLSEELNIEPSSLQGVSSPGEDRFEIPLKQHLFFQVPRITLSPDFAEMGTDEYMAKFFRPGRFELHNI